MPIGDLLAQITGDKPTASPTISTTPLPRPGSAVKRKANDELRGDALKAPRTEGGASGPTTGGYKGTSASRPALVSRPSATTGAPLAKPASAPAKVADKARTSKPAVAPSARPAPPVKSGPPKKGSYAEIMARGQRAQSTMGQVGKIQHKVMGKAPKEEPRKELKKDAKATAARPVSKFTGTARPGTSTARPQNGVSRPLNGASRSTAPLRNGTGTKPGAPPSRTGTGSLDRSKTKALPEEEKKVKKAATATTGYSGTARPRPNAGTERNGKRPAPGGALLNPRSGPRYGGSSRRSRYDEEDDEELDDFIEYDDDEEEDMRGPRYRYDSGSESDMEAGMDDIYEEERSAERYARLEDAREQALEAKLKAEKEERKRRAAMEARRR
ncbi:hypothetical protein B0T11DRAFT_341531 [Plectosphaerella cucumerina]|uniref:SPT2 chromatin protein n=1 Tax=Plectosphaerella cucumerina TaxID=40658 RepID=A0A8K0TJB3_9PEZI|nr:hypothetical protein B0T11DRAFT_341531 [Plectosphaerella cucumerina]